MSKKWFATLASVALVLVAGLAVMLLAAKGRPGDKQVKQASTITLTSERVGLSVKRDTALTERSLSQANQAKGQLWELAQPVGSQQQFVLNAFHEEGASLKKLTGYTKQSLRDSVMSNINIQLPKQYPQYKELTQRNLTVNGIEANETIFEYVNSGVKIKQRLLLLFKNSDTAVYIRGQAKADEYAKVNQRYFEPVFTSASFD